MKVLAFLQNQWFHDPDHVRSILKRHPEARRRIVRYSLFCGCKTGRTLKTALGEEWCRKIVWEEASPQIGGRASSSFPADPGHILTAIEQEKPTVIIALGQIASEAITSLALPGITILTGPHPTARGVGPLTALRSIRAALDTMAGFASEGEYLVRTALNPAAAWPFPPGARKP